MPPGMFCKNCKLMGLPLKVRKVKISPREEDSEKTDQIGRFTNKLKERMMSVTLSETGKNIFEINGKLTHIKWDRLKNDNYIFRFDASMIDLDRLDLFVFICHTYAMTYVIPSSFLRDKLGNKATMNKDRQSYVFSIHPYKDLMELDKNNKLDIKDHYNNFDRF